MKRFVCVILAASALALSFAGCSSLPKDPAEEYTAQLTYVDPAGMTVVVTNPDTGKTEIKGIETVGNIQLVFEDYYVYGKSVAKITDVEIQDLGIGSVRGFADVEMITVGTRKNGMKIDYTAYDKDGNVVRDSYVLAVLEETENSPKVNDGDVVERRLFEFPRGTVKVVFNSYVEP